MIVNPLVVISEEKIEKFTHKVSDTVEHLHINSEDLVIDKLKMTANFTGNVVMCFDNVKLSGQKAVFLFRNKEIRNIKSIVISDNVKVIKSDGTVMLADKADYELEASQLRLKGNVIIEKDNGIVSAKEVIYYGKINNVTLNGKVDE